MPKAQSSRGPAKQRHNPLSEEYAPSQLKQKAGHKRKVVQPENDNVIDSKASRKILKIGQDLVEEVEQEDEAARPSKAFDFTSRLEDGALPTEDEEEEPVVYDNDDEEWGDEEEEDVDEIETDPNDQDAFERFFPSAADPSLDPNNLSFDPVNSAIAPSDSRGGGTNLADLILKKIAAHEAGTDGPTQALQEDDDFSMEEPQELPPKVIEVYNTIGELLARHRSGPLPKPFKVLPTLSAQQIPILISLTSPQDWTPHVHFLATRLFISSRPDIAQPFLTNILLPKVRDEIHETRKLHVHLYSALKKSLYKPACFFKGILFPLLEDGTCTLREAHIISSVVSRVSIPVLHSAAALLRLCDIAAEQFSTRKEDGGGGATNVFIRCLLEKKYALPYKVVDALVFHFLRFKSVDFVPGAEAMAIDAANGHDSAKGLPVLWHQSLLAFAQRYRNDITEDQREALMDLINAKGHRQMGPETRRELLEGRGRGVPAFEAPDPMGGDDTMMLDQEMEVPMLVEKEKLGNANNIPLGKARGVLA
jgi:essential nuclear protein 1